MIRRALRHSLAGLPITTLAIYGLPWESITALIFLGLVTYICRLVLVYRLAKKALDKVPAAKAAEVIIAVTGRGPAQPTRPDVGSITSRSCVRHGGVLSGPVDGRGADG
jgi:hypothetical protein